MNNVRFTIYAILVFLLATGAHYMYRRSVVDKFFSQTHSLIVDIPDYQKDKAFYDAAYLIATERVKKEFFDRGAYFRSRHHRMMGKMPEGQLVEALFDRLVWEARAQNREDLVDVIALYHKEWKRARGPWL